MCGPFIHGRTFVARNGFIHHCDPMRINRHSDFPRVIHTTVFPAPGTLDVWGKPIGTGVLWSGVNDYVDWGIRVANGSFEIQQGVLPFTHDPRRRSRSELPEEMLLKERKDLVHRFFPATQSALVAWMRTHWGKNGDDYEFYEGGAACLDSNRLWSSLPETLILKSSAREIRKASFPYVDRQAFMCAVLAGRDEPLETWAEMFREAPNEFWLARN